MSDFEAKANKSAPVVPKSFARRDHIRSIEIRVQKKWQENKVNEANVDITKPKFFVTFPYPYMNGRLHLGHAFSVTKAEFTARFQRLLGKNVLFPFAFHCTGMPIQAAANKLKEEIKHYGLPPVFPVVLDTDNSVVVETKDAEQLIAAKSKGKKTKLEVKGQKSKGSAAPMRQWDILLKMVPESEIPSFTDPLKWLNYFPPYGVLDLQSFGLAIDWRRSFITTSVNPYYDAFIRWQFKLLNSGERVRSGCRPNIYSVVDGQVCADHDRSSGEGIVPQEYTIVKLKVVQPYPEGSFLNNSVFIDKEVYLAAATLRPETMYGQTNCFVLPEGEYGAFEFKNNEVFIISERSAKGLAHQGFANEWGVVKKLLSVTGWQILGLALSAPNSVYEKVYALPLTTISMGKGTGVVTSVPSDAPDDYVALKELKDKPLWREKFGITAEMVEPFAVVPIIDIPGYGNTSAAMMCEKLEIVSSRDTEKLKLAKNEVYLKGFYEGIMLVGECVGMKVCEAKPVVREDLIKKGFAIPYFEPENTVTSRSGDECIVALTDQWYLAYGDPDWQGKVLTHLHSADFNTFNKSILESFDLAVKWLKEWACSRQFGLGTQLPWDEKWVIDSLSDSTIYMAYYTIANYLHGSIENLNGVQRNENLQFSFEDLTDEIFSYIFLGIELPSSYNTKIPIEILQSMRKEFEYWYPMDLRVSAKDLIPNHLTMSLYNHIEIWKDRPELWPQGFYCNGHIMVDAEKMSKSRGNFLMLLECVEEYTADATRFALADAGDSLEDANFDRSVANQAITYLFNEEEWIKSVLLEISEGKLRSSAATSTVDYYFMDKAFSNEIDYLIEATLNDYNKMCFRDGIHRCWFDMLILRDIYRDWSIKCNIAMQKEIILRFIDALVKMILPICPHWSENIWELLGNTDSSVCFAVWPSFTSYDRQIRKEFSFFKDFMKNIRLTAIKLKINAPRSVYIYVANTYEKNKIKVLQYLQAAFNKEDGKFPVDFVKELKVFLESNEELKKETKFLIQFGAFMRDEAEDRGFDALAIDLPFNQRAIIEENFLYIKQSLELEHISVFSVDESSIPGEKKKIDNAAPGKPSYSFYTAK